MVFATPNRDVTDVLRCGSLDWLFQDVVGETSY